jgi:hypothetical protein
MKRSSEEESPDEKSQEDEEDEEDIGTPQKNTIEVEIPPGSSEAEVFWWNAVLAGHSAWQVMTKFKSKLFYSPWSVRHYNRLHGNGCQYKWYS